MNAFAHPCRQVIAASPVTVLATFTWLIETEGVAPCDWATPDLVGDRDPTPAGDSEGVPLAVLDRDLEPVFEGATTWEDATTDVATDADGARVPVGDLDKPKVEMDPVEVIVWVNELLEALPTTTWELEAELEEATAAELTTGREAAIEVALAGLESETESVTEAEMEIDGKLDNEIEGLGWVTDKVSELETLVVITIVPVMKLWTLQW